MPLWKITDNGPSKVEETKFKQENHSIESVLEKAEKYGTRLAIEVDGHRYHGETVNIDRGRDAFLIAQGYEVFRTSARDVLETPYEVVHQIEQKLSG